MPNQRGRQGQGRATLQKEATLGRVLGCHIVRELRADPAILWHVDLNAGAGRNIDARVAGSPEVFLRQLIKRKVPRVMAMFYERKRAAAAALATYLAERLDRIGRQSLPSLEATIALHDARGAELLERHVRGAARLRTQGELFAAPPAPSHFTWCFEIHAADNRQALPHLLEVVRAVDDPRRAAVSIISDPNGWSVAEGSLDLAVARETLAALPRALLLVTFFYGRAKAAHGLNRNGTQSPFTRRGPIPTRHARDYVPLRPFWLISEQDHQHVYLAGSHWPLPEFTERRGLRLWSTKSPIGRGILEDCDQFRGGTEHAEQPRRSRRTPV